MGEEKIAGFEEYYGRTLKPEYRGEEGSAKNGKVIITRPDHYESGNIHINMYAADCIQFNEGAGQKIQNKA